MSGDSASSPAPAGEALRVFEVDVVRVRPLRLAFLRPGQGEAAVIYETDALPDALHFIAERREHALGALSLHGENRVAGEGPWHAPGIRVRGLALDPAIDGATVSAALLAAAIEAAHRAAAVEVWANVRERQVPCFLAAGFGAVSDPFETPSLGSHLVMARSLYTKPQRA